MEKDPWYWVKVNASEIRHSLDFSPEPRTGGNVRSRLVEALSGIETDFIGNLTAVYSWVVPTTDLGKKFPDLLNFSSLAVLGKVEQIERFSTILFNPETKQRVLFEGGADAEEGEFRFGLSVQQIR